MRSGLMASGFEEEPIKCEALRSVGLGTQSCAACGRYPMTKWKDCLVFDTSFPILAN